MQVCFVIPGRLRGKGRVRSTWKANAAFPTVYTDAQTISHENIVRNAAHDAMGEWSPFEGAVSLTVLIFQLVPPSWSNKRAASAHYLTGKPDWDNVGKLVADSLNGIIYRDDSQISDGHVMRRYIQSGQERVEIIVEELFAERTVIAESAKVLPLFGEDDGWKTRRGAGKK